MIPDTEKKNREEEINKNIYRYGTKQSSRMCVDKRGRTDREVDVINIWRGERPRAQHARPPHPAYNAYKSSWILRGLQFRIESHSYRRAAHPLRLPSTSPPLSLPHPARIVLDKGTFVPDCRFQWLNPRTSCDPRVRYLQWLSAEKPIHDPPIAVDDRVLRLGFGGNRRNWDLQQSFAIVLTISLVRLFENSARENLEIFEDWRRSLQSFVYYLFNKCYYYCIAIISDITQNYVLLRNNEITEERENAWI